MKRLAKGKTWLWIIAVVVVALVAGRMWRARTAPAGGASSWSTGTAATGRITVSVSGSGALQPGRSEDVKSAVAGQVRRVLVSNGDTVTTGQVLIELVNETALLAWEQAQLTFEAESEKLDQMYGGVATGLADTTIRAAELRVEQARLNLESRQRTVDDLTLRARASGLVGPVLVAVGDELNAGAQLLTFYEGPRARVQLAVPESAAGGIAAGDRASVILAPLPDVHIVKLSLNEESVYRLRLGDLVIATIDGKWVSSYSPIVRGTVAEIRNAGAFFEVTCRLPGLPASIPAGATAGYMQVYPTGVAGDQTVLTVAGKISIVTDVWGLEASQLAGEGYPGKVVSVAGQATRSATGAVTYAVLIELDDYPLTAKSGMSAHAAIYPDAGEPEMGLAAVEFPQTRLAAPAGGKVMSLNVREGDRVEAGAILAELDNDGARYQLELARNDYAVAQASLGDLTKPQYTDRELRFQEIKVRQAELVLEQRESEALGLRMTAPCDGRVAALHASAVVGRDIAPGLTLCRVLNYDTMQLVVLVDELEVDQVAPGMDVEVAVDALPGQSFAGEVSDVSQEGQYTQGVSRFSVTITVETSPRLRSQMTATATIAVADKPDALLIPAEAVLFFGGGEGEVSVLLASGQLETRQIKIGLYNNASVEVLSGVQAGEKVVTGEIVSPGGLPSWRNPRQGTLPVPR